MDTAILRPVRRVSVFLLLLLIGLLLWLAPAFPALTHYGTLPRQGEKPLNVLLAGVDVEYDYGAATWPYPALPESFNQRTDTIVLAQIRPGGTVKLLSVPRDTWVPLAGWSGGQSKINAANVHGGATMLVNTVRDLTGVPVDGYALLSLNALRGMTEALGGLTLDVPQRMKYDDNAGHLHIDLQPGRQHLNGEQIEGFLRFRKDGLGDIGRVARQQLFLTALLGELRRPANVWRWPRVAAALDANARTNLTRQQVGELLGAVSSGVKVNTYTVPGDFGSHGTWQVNQARLGTLLDEQFRDPNDPHNLRILVLNSNAPTGTARRVKAKLGDLGYTRVSTGNDARPLPVTTISGPAQTSADLIRILGYGQSSPAAPDPGSDITIRLGQDVK